MNRRHIAIRTAALAATFLLFLCAQVHADTLTFEIVLEKALKHSYDLKIAETEVSISNYRKDEVRSLYFPSLSTRLYNEYVNVLENQTQDVVAVGDAVSATANSTYQHSAVAGLNYLLYDFGARGLKYDSAKRDIRISRFSASQAELDLQRDVLDTFSKGLITSRQIALNREIIDRRKEIFIHSQKLRDAGIIGQHEVERAGLKFAEVASLEDYYRDIFLQALGRLGYLTGESYPQESTTFADLEEPHCETLALPDVKMLPGVRAIDEQIVNKEAERQVNNREMLPHLNLQTYYRMFGRDEDSFSRSFRNLSDRDITVGVVAEWEFFSGFRDLSKGRRLKQEIESLRLKREKRVAEFQEDVTTLYQICRLFGEARERGANRLHQITQGRRTLSRLNDKQMLDRVSALEREIEFIEHEMDAVVKLIEQTVAAYKLKFYQTQVSHKDTKAQSE